MSDDDGAMHQHTEASMHMYLLLYSGGGTPETEEETNAMTEAWGAWLAGIGDALVDGNPFTPNAKSISPDGSVSDDPIGPMAYGILDDQGEVHG